MDRTKSRGLVYLRRSTDKQEISLPSQLDWAIAAARRHGVALDATPADLEYMQARGLSRHKALRLDDGITGADLSRPGFVAVNDDALSDRTVSHLFIYKRDRFARPEDALQVAQIEKRLLLAGITVVFSDAVSMPLRRGEQNIVRDIELLLPYYQGGEELRKHAERVLGFQRRLAEGGHRTGGNPPYGFARVLVDAAGKVLEELPPGKVVQQSGCHVRVEARDPAKLTVWLQILRWKEMGWGVKRIATTLNEQGVPSPDAGRTRTDQGVKHRVSGKWSPNTVAELCRNPIILGVQRYGRRSEGAIRRLGAEGSRLLEESDLTGGGDPKVIRNDAALQVQRQVGEAQFDAEKWRAIQAQMDERGRAQRGIPRTKDPAKYPLACRLVDLTGGCGSVLYARTTHGRAVYTCGRYMRAGGTECASNQVDAEAMLRFVLGTLKQLVDRHGNRERLREKLLERARRAAEEPGSDPRAEELARLRGKLAELGQQRETIEYRMARERDNERYDAIARQFTAVRAETQAAEQALADLEAAGADVTDQSPEARADAALALLDDVARIAADPAARAEVNPLLQRLGVRVGLTFGASVKGKKRVVRRLLSGVMTFGGAPLPVPLHGNDNAEGGPPEPIPGEAERQDRNRGEGGFAVGESTLTRDGEVDVVKEVGRVVKHTPEGGNLPPSGVAGDRSPARPDESRPEGISITKGSRGDWI